MKKSQKMDKDKITSTLTTLGFDLDTVQPQMSGERFLMTRDKWVLIGKTSKDKRPVVIKVSNLPLGREEINKEKAVRDLLEKISFAEDTLLFPKEIHYEERNGYLFLITEFITQEKVFSAYSMEEQFFMSLTIFEEQEAFHATTFEHLKAIGNTFDIYKFKEYWDEFNTFNNRIADLVKNTALNQDLDRAKDLLHEHRHLIEKYNNYLTHTDLAPGNTRIHDREIYMIDLSSVRFGNKYEGWARFINWALIHSPELEKLLTDYVKQNRGPEESICLNLMRIYKSVLLIDYYARSLAKTTGDLELLTQKRIEFWHQVLRSLMDEKPLSSDAVQSYREIRNKLRSPEETERQKEFNIPSL